MRRLGLGVAVVLLGVVGTGCQSKLHDENLALHRQNRELQERNRQLEAERDQRPDPSQLATMQQEIASRDARINELQQQLQRPAPGAAPTPGLEGIEVTRDERAGTMTINLPGDVLFTSGSADLKESSKATLNKIVAAIKKDYSGKKIFVDGHSDSDPINRTRKQWEDNLDLSAARARSVEKYLVSQGLNGNLIEPRAFGPTAPKGDKAKSRRVEIVVATR